MLLRLNIRNIALIEKLDMCFGNGFNVLTGETGAGKSIIIDAVNFVLGERTSKDIIKHGEQKARVEAEFEVENPSSELSEVLNANELEIEDGIITLSRELSITGRNICRINGSIVNIAVLKKVSDTLIDIHGQHEHQSLLVPERHILFLDSFIGEKAQNIKCELRTLSEKYREKEKVRLSGFVSEAEREREIDILSYQVNEIKDAMLEENEDNRLESELVLLANAERINAALFEAAESLSGENNNALYAVKNAEKQLSGIAEFSDEYKNLAQNAADAYYSLEDIDRTLKDLCDNFDFDRERLDIIENRLELISSLKKKYGDTIAQIQDFKEKAAIRLDEMINADETRKRIEAEQKVIKSEYEKLSQELSDLRKKGADELSKRILSEIHELGLKRAEFQVNIEPTGKDELAPNGIDKVEFLLSANTGEPLKSMSKVASGGELSRIMLAFKSVFADSDDIGTLIFDEIDTGISGKAAGIVGEKMVGISNSHQVICITHLPQIAALADVHFAVAKSDDGETTRVTVSELDMDGQYERIAQMMDGGATVLSISHAKELVENQIKVKNSKRTICRK